MTYRSDRGDVRRLVAAMATAKPHYRLHVFHPWRDDHVMWWVGRQGGIYSTELYYTAARAIRAARAL